MTRNLNLLNSQIDINVLSRTLSHDRMSLLFRNAARGEKPSLNPAVCPSTLSCYAANGIGILTAHRYIKIVTNFDLCLCVCMQTAEEAQKALQEFENELLKCMESVQEPEYKLLAIMEYNISIYGIFLIMYYSFTFSVKIYLEFKLVTNANLFCVYAEC